MKKLKLITPILLAILLIGIMTDCQKDCTKIANKQRTGKRTSKSIYSKNTSSGVPHNSIYNPMLIDWMGVDTIAGTIHGCAKLDTLTGIWKPSTWVTFPAGDINLSNGRTLSFSSTNAVIDGNIYGDGYLNIIGCNAEVIIRGVLDDNVYVTLEGGGNLIYDKPLGDTSVPFEKHTVEVPCSWDLPKNVLEDGIWYTYSEYDGTGVVGNAYYKSKL